MAATTTAFTGNIPDGKALASEWALSIPTTAGGTPLTSAVYAAAPLMPSIAFITVEVNSIRFTVDGSAPTANNGHLIFDGGVLTIVGFDQIKAFLAIGLVGSAKLQVSYFV